jgi:hypothetical protein
MILILRLPVLFLYLSREYEDIHTIDLDRLDAGLSSEIENSIGGQGRQLYDSVDISKPLVEVRHLKLSR